MADAVDENGAFTAPCELVSGFAPFPFDELETLKATVTAVAPLAAGDKKLKDARHGRRALADALAPEPGAVAEGLTTRIKEAFAQGSRALPAGYLDVHTERSLLEQRHHQRRTVFGDLCREVSSPALAPAPRFQPTSRQHSPPSYRCFTRLTCACSPRSTRSRSLRDAASRCVVALARAIAVPTGTARSS